VTGSCEHDKRWAS